MSNHRNFKLRVWRQRNGRENGRFEELDASGISPDMSFLEMLDVVNSRLEAKGLEPIVFSHDCREGICGSCGLFINGVPHGPGKGITTCQLYMRTFRDGETITIEPWRAAAFPVIKDLTVDRSALDKIQAAGGYVSVNVGSAPDGNAIPIARDLAEAAMDSAACIGCGACVAACKNGSAMLFTSAKVSQFAFLPQGNAERRKRVISMVKAHDDAGFGACSNTGACEAGCPKEIKITNIHRLHREFLVAKVLGY